MAAKGSLMGHGQAMFLALALVTLTGCDQLGIETPAKTHERALAEAKAIGGACRHALRAIEDCYTMNPKAQKASVFEGWREMDEYMRENKLEGVAPTVPRAAAPASSAASKERPGEGGHEAEEDEVVEEESPRSGRGSKSSDSR